MGMENWNWHEIIYTTSQLITALSAIFAAGSSVVNRNKINQVTMKVDKAVIVAVETRKENITQTEEVKQAVEEVKEIVKNGKENGRDRSQ
jgi:hypothetical protein